LNFIILLRLVLPIFDVPDNMLINSATGYGSVFVIMGLFIDDSRTCLLLKISHPNLQRCLTS